MLIMSYGVQQLFAGDAPSLERQLHSRLADLPEGEEDDQIFSFKLNGRKLWAINDPIENSYTILLPEEY